MVKAISGKQPWNVVVPVTGFLTLSIVSEDSNAATQKAAIEANRLLGALDWSLDVGAYSGRRVALRIDPIAEQASVAIEGEKELAPHEASRARV
jgi:hypothetical protein